MSTQTTSFAPFAGLRASDDFGTAERPKNYREAILFMNPNGSAPLQALMSMMGSEGTNDPEFNWWEEKLGHIRVCTQGSTTAAASTISLRPFANPDSTTFGTPTTDARSLVAGDLIAVESLTTATEPRNFQGEVLMVVENPGNATSVKVQRAFHGTAAVIADGSYLTKIGTAFAEGSRAPKSHTRNPVKLFNYAQIFKRTYEVTETAKATNYRTGSPVKNDKRRAFFDFNRDMEQAFLWGQKAEKLGSNGKPLRTTQGIVNFLETNVTRFGSTGNETPWTEDEFIEFLAPMFNWEGDGRSSNERIAFIGNEALTKINQLARNSNSTRINFDKQLVNMYGMQFMHWVLPQGSIYLKTHPLFNTHPYMTRSMLCINPPFIKERPLRGTMFNDNAQENDEDIERGYWMGETGIEVNYEETMCFASNIGG